MPSIPAVALAALAITASCWLDAPVASRSAASPAASHAPTACEGARAPLPGALLYELRAGAFPRSGHPDVAVHVPPGFDATRRPGVVVYLHGWNGCVAAALSADEGACREAGPARAGSDLAAQLDAAGVNALLVAIEVRVDERTGEPGGLAMPAGLRDLLRELLGEALAVPLGCPLAVDALDRVVVIAHSGGYQAAAGVLQLGDVPRIAEVVLLDALYGGEDVFAGWIDARLQRFDARAGDHVRFVDLYTCCGGTTARSRALARRAGGALAAAGLANALYDDDGEGDVDAAALEHPAVFKRVPRDHSALPAAYVRPVLEAAGFARIAAPEAPASHSLPPK